MLDQKGKSYFENTRYAFPKMVELFLQYEVHVTWAAVGMLYNQNAAEWRANQPKELPTYNDPKYSSYAWVAENGLMEPTDPYHFAPDLISLIENKPGFEIGTHTYCHYYCKEAGQTAAQFKADLKLAKEVAEKRGHQLKSLVFPRNQFNEDYLQVCYELGIEIVRSNPDCWYWDANLPESLAKKIFRTGDAYSGLLGAKVFSLDSIDINQKPLCLPASRLYRAWTSKSNILNKLKLQRILGEMTFAAKTGGYYHLWWHPHNFGWHPDECLKELEQILQHYRFLHQKYGLQSLTMWETKESMEKLKS